MLGSAKPGFMTSNLKHLQLIHWMFSCQNGCKRFYHISWCDARNCRTSRDLAMLPNSPSSRTRPAHPYWSTCKNTSPLACCWLLSQTIGSFPQSSNSKILPCRKVCSKQLSTNTKECTSSQKQCTLLALYIYILHIHYINYIYIIMCVCVWFPRFRS